MTDLEIPERAWQAFGDASYYGNGLHAAAPIIVAAAYLRVANGMVTGWSSDQCVAYLRRCADELDPEEA